MAIRTLEPVKGLVPVAGVLKNDSGTTIAAENIDVRRIQYVPQKDQSSVEWKGRWLEKAFPEEYPSNWTTWIWITFYIPENTLPGIYHGAIHIKSDSAQMDIPVSLRVLDMTLTYPEGSWGIYLPGHFHSKKYIQGENWAPEGWDPENLTRYFRFWKSYHLNAPTFYHVFPDFKCVDGHAVTGYHDLSQLMASVKEAGLEGETVIMLSWLEFWSHAAATKLDQLKKENKSIEGEVSVFNGGFKGLEYKTWTYSDEAKRIFREELQQMLDLAQHEKWPPFKLIVEEEVGSPTIKTAAYDQFMPILKEMAPDKAYIVDNAVGWGYETIDRGVRDQIPIREYNNWTPEAIAAANRDNAQVRTYNYGFTRGAFGFCQRALNTTGYRQWADQFVHSTLENYRWQVIRIRHEGMITSVDMERSREGMIDQGYYNTLLLLAEKLKSQGLKDVEDSVLKTLKEVVADIPMNNRSFNQWLLVEAPDRELEIRRWRLALAILNAQKALGQKVSIPNVVSKNKPHIIEVNSLEQQETKTDKVLYVAYTTDPVTLDGHAKETCWREPKNTTGSLWWTWNTESGMRAKASSLDEFKRMPPPSNAQARFAYDAQGLYILVECNHSTPKDAKCKHSDDDQNIWQDDSMEFFFKLNPQAIDTYHLIVNVAGKRTLLMSDQVVKNPGICVSTFSPINSSGGYAQEILIPWKSLSLKNLPRLGSTWQAQVGREFHSWNQVTCWSQVNQNFAEQNKWGQIIFSDSKMKGSKALQPGRKELQMDRCPIYAIDEQPFDVDLTLPSVSGQISLEGAFVSPSGQTFQLSPITLVSNEGRQRVRISPSGLSVGRWTLHLWLVGKSSMKSKVTHDLNILPSPTVGDKRVNDQYRYSVSVPMKDKYLDAAKDAGVEWLEISGGNSADENEKDQRKYLVDAQTKILSRGLKVASIHLCPWHLKHDDAVNQMLLKNAISTMRMGRELFPEAIYILHPGELIEDPVESVSMVAGCRRFVLDVGKAAEELGVIVAVENLRKGDPHEKGFPRIGQDVKWIREIVDQSPSLGICLDTGHANISGDVGQMTKDAGNKLLIIHLSDNFGIYDDHLFPGEGKIPWKKLAEIICTQTKFQGILELEIKLPEEKEQIISVMKKSLEFSKETFNEK
jgi:sugar phosphate isomerase/epimerase